MFAHANVISSRSYTNSKGKNQQASGRPAISIAENWKGSDGKPMIQMKVESFHSVGTGSRGGAAQEFDDKGHIAIDIEACSACVRLLVEKNIIKAEEIFDRKQLLEAALRLETGRGQRLVLAAAQ
jgi:hypothetical protein